MLLVRWKLAFFVFMCTPLSIIAFIAAGSTSLWTFKKRVITKSERKSHTAIQLANRSYKVKVNISTHQTWIKNVTILVNGAFTRQTWRNNNTSNHVDQENNAKPIDQISRSDNDEFLFHEYVQSVVDVISTLTSFVFFTLGVVLLHIYGKQSCTKTFIHKHLMASSAASCALYLSAIAFREQYDNFHPLCVTTMVLKHCALIAGTAWMTVEGINLIIVIVLVFQLKQKLHLTYFSIGYGVPVVITAITLACFYEEFYYTEDCLSLRSSLWLLKAPMAAFLMGNFAILLILFYHMHSKSECPNPRRERRAVKAFFVLSHMLGTPFIMALFIEYSPIILSYIYLLVSGFYGVIIFVLFCGMDKEVRRNTKMSCSACCYHKKEDWTEFKL
ncbi:vasoactive intestinal polypeptide receptor 1-like isoform X2 [Hydractinia symbiolongicarpus]|uniref:vasoactive intestinal polypeptide receptor 1-like isoform X2 n=1 Tax=Hydractinia symbiolongicarpus TaxID=13093 RepID=UPI00254A590B|nr:vasoactive intestinal polypeptide receptor 1-like isoform X2 [Hydractinia symbiolongicarpus]